MNSAFRKIFLRPNAATSPRRPGRDDQPEQDRDHHQDPERPERVAVDESPHVVRLPLAGRSSRRGPGKGCGRGSRLPDEENRPAHEIPVPRRDERGTRRDLMRIRLNGCRGLRHYPVCGCLHARRARDRAKRSDVAEAFRDGVAQTVHDLEPGVGAGLDIDTQRVARTSTIRRALPGSSRMCVSNSRWAWP